MRKMSYTKFRVKLADALDHVNENHEPILITRGKKAPSVLISLEDFCGYEETNNLMGCPNNGQRLSDSVERLNAGVYIERGFES